jgi:hypothetical protein
MRFVTGKWREVEQQQLKLFLPLEEHEDKMMCTPNGLSPVLCLFLPVFKLVHLHEVPDKMCTASGLSPPLPILTSF